ncbi:DUF2510 domain-containing protein [Microbacterium sp. PRC9]|nr:DUF2510 domain-containing protein [Microbacterium sp. PRC9]
MSDGSQGGPPPGWYEDASRADRLRWWNGAAWTEDYRPVATDAAATVSMDVVGDAGSGAVAPLSRAQLRARRTADSDAVGSTAAAGEGSGVPGAAVGSPAPPSVAEESHAAAVWPAPSSLGEESFVPLDAEVVFEASAPVVVEHEEPHAAAVWPAPSSLAEPAETRDEASVDAPSAMPEPEVPASAPNPQVAPGPRPPASREVSTNGSRAAKGEPFPDQLAPRRPAPVDDRLPTPIVYQPVSSSYVGEMRPPLPEAAPANVPARASIVLMAVAALGGLAVVFWLGGWNESVAGLVSLVSVAFAAGAFFLAIGGLIVATQRRTSRLLSGIAIVVSIGLAAWLAIVATQQALAILN